MGWRVVQQPDGKFAIFSEVSDGFVCVAGSEEEMREEVRERLLREFDVDSIVERKMNAAKSNLGRWDEAIGIIRSVGDDPESQLAEIEELTGIKV